VRYHVHVVHTVLRFLLIVLCARSTVAGFEQALDPRLIGDAIAIGQSRIEAVRTRYHQPYRIQVARPPIDDIEIVTSFRRVVLLAEERVQAGNRLFGQREALSALGDRSMLVEVLVGMTFHPLNVLVGVPEYEVELATASPGARISPRSISRVPRFGFPLPGGSQPLVGGTIAASFGAAALNPHGVYDVVVSEKGKELARTRVNLGQLR
jgi:hypothetical protein